jgi:hypothetical protein
MHNFGKIKHNIFEVAIDGIVGKNKSKKALLKKFANLIKESKILKTQARVYHNLESKVNEDEFIATEYIKENIALLQKFDIEDIVKENNKLEVLLEGMEIIDQYEGQELHESIHNLITLKRNTKTVDTIVESTKLIKEHIKNNKPAPLVNEDYLPNSVLAKFLAEKYNNKYCDLTETEQRLVVSVLENDVEKQALVMEEIKSEALTAVNESMIGAELELKEKLLNVKERLLETKYVEDNFVESVAKLINLKNTLQP